MTLSVVRISRKRPTVVSDRDHYSRWQFLFIYLFIFGILTSCKRPLNTWFDRLSNNITESMGGTFSDSMELRIS